MSPYYRGAFFLFRKIRSYTVKVTNYSRRTIKIFSKHPRKVIETFQ